MNNSVNFKNLLGANYSNVIPDLTGEQETAFRNRIEAVTAAVLVFPNNCSPYSVYMDEFEYHVGADIWKMDTEKTRRPVGFGRGVLNSHEKNY